MIKDLLHYPKGRNTKDIEELYKVLVDNKFILKSCPFLAVTS